MNEWLPIATWVPIVHEAKCEGFRLRAYDLEWNQGCIRSGEAGWEVLKGEENEAICGYGYAPNLEEARKAARVWLAKHLEAQRGLTSSDPTTPTPSSP